MVVNLKARGISRSTCKLVQTSTLIKKNYYKNKHFTWINIHRVKLPSLMNKIVNFITVGILFFLFEIIYFGLISFHLVISRLYYYYYYIYIYIYIYKIQI